MNKLLVFLLLNFILIGTAQNEFATLEVQPYGEQVFDLATNSTLLPSGGLINEREVGVTLDVGYASYREGSFISATRAVVNGRFGNIQTGGLYLDIPNDTLRTHAGTTLNANGGLVVQSTSTSVYLNPAVAVGEGGVSSTNPPFNSESIVVDTIGSQALLVAPYEYRDGPFTLRSNTPGDLLQVIWYYESDGSTSFEASSQIDPNLYNSLARYLIGL